MYIQQTIINVNTVSLAIFDNNNQVIKFSKQALRIADCKTAKRSLKILRNLILLSA